MVEIQKFIPHSYQEYAIQFVEGHPIAALILDMGLGKTVITLSAIWSLLFDSFEVRRVLVVAPLRVAMISWPDEIRKWEHLNGLAFSVAVGDERQRRAAILQPTQITIINRENLDWLVTKSRIRFDWDMIVVDELSSFKSRKADRTKALMKVRPRVKRIVGLTGTPCSNGLMDLWAEYRVLDMGERLGRYISSYQSEFFVPDKRNGMRIFSYKPKPGADEAIYKKISDITISMKSADHLKLPERIDNVILVKLNADEMGLLRSLKNDLIATVDEATITAANAAVLANKLLQMANGAIYTDDGKTVMIHDQKLDALDELVEAATGKPVLVCYWFKHDYERIKKRFKNIEPLDGEDSIRRWNAGEIPLAAMHPASAGHGLNLQSGGSTLVWFGLTWSLELYQQTNARLWRQGQRETVVIHHLVADGTMDQDVMAVLARKDQTQSALIKAVKAVLKGA